VWYGPVIQYGPIGVQANLNKLAYDSHLAADNHQELLRRVAALEQQNAVLERRIQNPVLEPRVRDLVTRATAFLFEVGEDGKRQGVGVAFFSSPTTAFTCRHCLPVQAVAGTSLSAVVEGRYCFKS
jgi:hypothetical protein